MTETHIPQASMIETPPSAEGSYEEYREYLDRVKAAVEDFIEKNDIDPEDVIVAGYSTDRPKSEGQEHVNEDGSPQYFFGDLVSLSAPAEERGDAFDADEVLDSLVVNPAYYALKKATPGYGAIGIYSKSKLDELSGGAEEYDEEFGTSLYTTLNEEDVELSKYGEILVGEKLAIDNEEKKLGKYETGYDSKPTEEALGELYDILDLPDNPTERADEVLRQFTKGEDIARFVQVIHQYAVPGVVTVPVRHTMSSVNAEGVTQREFATPEERPLIFQYAAQKIAEIASMRSTNRNEMEDRAALDTIADIVALSSLFAHPFNDGNGRDARISAELIRNGSNDRETLNALAQNRPTEGFRINGYLPLNDNDSFYEVLDSLVMKDLPLIATHARERRRQELIAFPTTSSSIDTFANVAKWDL